MTLEAPSRQARRFFDPWESAPPAARERARRRRLEEYAGFAAANVRFYRERLRSFDARAEHPLARVPVLKSDDLRGLLPPSGTGLLSERTTGYNVFQSGGTTGFPKTTLFSHAELEQLYLPNARGFHACGLTRDDKVCNLFAVGGLYMTFLHIHRMLEQFGCMNFPFSNHTPVDFIHTVARLFRVDCFAGIASVVLNTLRGMEKLGLKDVRIRKVYYGGEHLYEADKRELRERYGVETIAAPGYGTVDSWYIGYQCLACPTGVFHAHDDQVWLEIVDDETGKPCPPGAVGMAYVTAFPRRLTPIIRYRVGDRMRWLDRPCACGRTTPLFELLGRGDDVLRIGFDSVDYNFIQESVSRVPGLLGSVQMQKLRISGRDQLILRCESDAPPGRFAALARRLEKIVIDARPTLRKAIEGRSVRPLKVEVLPSGAIARNPRTGKLIRSIDAL